MTGVYLGSALASAFIATSFATLLGLQAREHNARQKSLRQSWQGARSSRPLMQAGLPEVLLDQLVRFDMARGKKLTLPRGGLAQGYSRASIRKLEDQLRSAGMAEVSVSAAYAWRLRASLFGAACLGLIGLSIGPLFACVALLAGALGGWLCLGWALRTRIAARTYALESHLSEAIEVMCLGLRAGLSFERSMQLYCENFPSQLSAELAHIQHIWHTGLLSREAALRSLAQAYDSQLFERVIESIVRSLRFGSPLANSLEDVAHEARRARRAHIEEKVMKAPVKMMLPLGLLILPSMLLLVMGPIMLELVTGF